MRSAEGYWAFFGSGQMGSSMWQVVLKKSCDYWFQVQMDTVYGLVLKLHGGEMGHQETALAWKCYRLGQLPHRRRCPLNTEAPTGAH